MDTHPAPYVPINCEFHDLLEIAATHGQAVPILFHDEAGALQARSSRVVDVYSRQGAEFLSTGSGEPIRLDRLVAVDGVRLASFPAEGSACAV